MYVGAVLFEGLEIDSLTAVLGAFIVSIVLFVAMMIYYKLRVSKLEQYVEYLKEHGKVASDVSMIAKKIESDIRNGDVKAPHFEVEQEEKAIISYQELLTKEKKKSPYLEPAADEALFSSSYEKTRPVYSSVAPIEKVTSRPVQQRPVAQVQAYSNEEVKEQIKRVPEEVRASAVKEKPVVRESQAFLSNLVSLRNNLK